MTARGFSYAMMMKKLFCSLLMLVPVLPALTGCSSYNYDKHLSEVRSDLFCAQTEEFSLTLSCVSREYPYAADGVAAPMSDLVEISLRPVAAAMTEYTVTAVYEGGEWGGEMSFRNAQSDYYYSQGVEVFPSDSVTLRVSWGEETRDLVATSVKNEHTMSVSEALSCVLSAEKERINSLMRGGELHAEFHVRLLRRDKNYYYVGIVDESGKTFSLLLDSENGEVLARREPR